MENEKGCFMAEEDLTGGIISFGTDNYRSIIGIVQSETSKESAEIAEARNEDGKVFLMKAYSKTSEKTFEALFAAGTTPPEVGKSITVGSWSGIVTQATVTRSNTDFTRISITAVRKDTASITSL